MRIRWGRVLLVLILALAACGLIARMTGVFSNLEVSLNEPDSNGETGSSESFWGDDDPDSDTTSPTEPDEGSDDDADANSDASSETEGGLSGEDRSSDSNLPPFRVLTLQYTPYMATLVHMEAGGYLEALGYDLQLYDVYDPDLDLDEEGQCEAVAQGQAHALATTLDATRKCGGRVGIGIPIGQSAGNDAIIVKDGVDSWSEIFNHSIAFTGASVSEYMACFASNASGRPIEYPLSDFIEAGEAVDAWINSGAEQDILSVVAWEPEISRALEAVPGSEVILSSADVRILWDVLEFSKIKVKEEPEAFGRFTLAYYQALLDLTRDPDSALQRMVEWAGDDEDRLALMTTKDAKVFRADLENEAFATLRDARLLMGDRTGTLTNRLDEAAYFWNHCGSSVPDVENELEMVLPEFVNTVAEDRSLLGSANSRPSSKAFQVSEFTDAGAVTDDQLEEARTLFQTGVEIEFKANQTDVFVDDSAAEQTLNNAVRFLRTCRDCVLQIQGGAAYPGTALCPRCTKEGSDQLAVGRGKHVHDYLINYFDIPEAQLSLIEEPHTPQFANSNVEAELKQDRRTFMTGLQLVGR